MKLGSAHLIRESTLEQLEGEIRRLHAECERLARLNQFRVVTADNEPAPPSFDAAAVSAELRRLSGEHEQELTRISRQHRVRMAQAVAEAEVASRRLAHAQRGESTKSALSEHPRQPIVPAQPPAHPIFLPESRLAHQLLDGLSGLEIGAGAHSPFGLRTRNVGLTPEMDPEDFEACKQYQISFCGTWAPVDLAGDAERIPVPDASEDFVIHAHVWEHLANPLGALREWTRVVKPGGIVFAIVPKRDTVPADAALPITPLWEHVLHYLLGSSHQDRLAEAGCEGTIGRWMHISRFTLESLREIGCWFNEYFHGPWLEELAALETDDKAGNGHLIAWRVKKNG